MKPRLSTRIKRGIAFFIDWNLCLLPSLIVVLVLAHFLQNGADIGVIAGLIMLVLMLASMACIAVRDVIFGGTSIGKRIFGLVVVDEKTLKKASLTQSLFRGIFFFIYNIDGLILLVSGKSIGDMAFGTVVLSKKELDALNEGLAYNVELQPKKTSTAKIIVTVVAICLAFLLVLIGVIFAMLESRKDSEEYKLAYDYLVNSETFAELNLDESKIWMNSYSSHSTLAPDSESPMTTVEMGFVAKLRSFTVICHRENGVWSVCEDCTRFK